MLYLTCTMISSVDLAHNGVSRAKDWVSVDCATQYVVRLPCCLQIWCTDWFFKTSKTIRFTVGFRTLGHTNRCDFANTSRSDDVGC